MTNAVDPHDSPLSLVVASQSVRVGLGLSGAALLVTGAVAVFVSKNALGTAALLAVGVGLVALGLFANNIRSIEAAGVALTVEATTVFREADQAEKAGQHDRAEDLRARAQRLLSASGAIAARFEDIRSHQPSSWARTSQLEQVMQEAREAAGLARHRDEVAAVFQAGGQGNRIAAIAMMQARPELVNTEVLVSALTAPHTNFEQYQALKAAEAFLTQDVRPSDNAAIRSATELALNNGLASEDSDRGKVARRILDLGRT